MYDIRELLSDWMIRNSLDNDILMREDKIARTICSSCVLVSLSTLPHCACTSLRTKVAICELMLSLIGDRGQIVYNLHNATMYGQAGFALGNLKYIATSPCLR